MGGGKKDEIDEKRYSRIQAHGLEFCYFMIKVLNKSSPISVRKKKKKKKKKLNNYYICILYVYRHIFVFLLRIYPRESQY